jgi:ABC-2 type transport system permease protein
MRAPSRGERERKPTASRRGRSAHHAAMAEAAMARAAGGGLRPYLQLMRLTFLKLMAYRMRYVTGIATYGIFVGGQYAIWRAIYQARGLADGSQLDGLTLREMATYLAIGYVARSAYFTNTDSEIAARFQTGDVALDLLKPLDFHGQWLAQAAGETLFRVLFFAAPMAVILFPLFGVLPPNGAGWWQFPLLFVAAFLVNAELNILAGTLSFFLEDITGLMSLKRNLIMLLSGLMVPLHFLWPWLAKSVVWLPFALISYYPTMAYVGQVGARTPPFAEIVVLAVGWLVALRMINITLWATAKRRLEVQGG